jgi:hypothetical protein
MLEDDKSMSRQPARASTVLICAVMEKPDDTFRYFSQNREAKEYYALFLRRLEPMH